MVTNRARNEIICIAPKTFQNLLRRLALLMFHVKIFRDPFRGKFPHVLIFMNDGPNLLT